MGRNAKPRKAYRPRPVVADPVEHAIARAGLLHRRQRLDLALPTQASLQAMRTGTGRWPEWRNLADALNVAEALSQDGIASDRLDEIRTAQHALAALHQRVEAGGPWTLRGPELTALQLAVELHGIQLKLASQGEVANAIERVQRRTKGALAGNVGRDTTVCIGHLGRAATEPTPAGA